MAAHAALYQWMLVWGWSMQVWVRCHEVVAKGGHHFVWDGKVHSAMSVGDSSVRVSIKSGLTERNEPFFYDSALVVASVIASVKGESVVVLCATLSWVVVVVVIGAACNLIAACNESGINWGSRQVTPIEIAPKRG